MGTGNGIDPDPYLASLVKSGRGNQNINDNSRHNHLSTPVLMLAVALVLFAMMIFGVELSRVSGSAESVRAEAQAARDAAAKADDFAHQAEREGRVAQDQVNSLNNRLNEQVRDLTVRLEVAEALINHYGLKESK